MKPRRLFILSAPSGAGKTTLAQALVAGLPDLAFSISHTTRPRRPGEQDGVHYFFVSPEEFQALVHRGDFLEHAQVFGNHYGTARAPLERQLNQGKDVILDIDWQGARAIKAQMPRAVSIFIMPPSKAALEQRLRNRGQDSPEVIQARMRAAIAEMEHYQEFDHVVVNDDLDAALADLQAIIRGDAGAVRAVKIDIPALLRR